MAENNTDNLTTGSAALFEASREAHEPSVFTLDRGTHESAGFLLAPDRMRLHDVREWLEKRRPTPERVKGAATLATLDSFVAHVERFKDPEGTALFAETDPKAPRLTAVYDYHRGPGRAQWCEHRAVYAFPLSAPWLAWRAASQAAMDQPSFAAFIEERGSDVVSPTVADPAVQVAVARFAELGLKVAGPSEVLTVSRGIAVTTESTVEHTETLATGEVRLVFDEKIKGLGGSALTVPGAFVVGIPVFEGDTERAALPVRLRLRVKDGAVAWSLAPLGLDDVVREAVRESIAGVRARTGLTVFEGTPER